MAKKLFTTEWYSLDRILQYPSSYYMIIGERSNGKTYAVKDRILDFIEQGKKFLYLRRVHQYITRKRMVKVFDDMNNKIRDRFGSYIYYSTDNGFYMETDKGIKNVGYVTSIEDFMLEKGISFEDIEIILFDEFIDTSYMKDEVAMFLNMMSTIARERQNLEVYMIGNTISKYCPYFKLMGIDIHQIKQGYIHRVEHMHGASVTLEYCKNKVQEIGKVKKNKYVGFDDNESVKMILYGEWEYKENNTHDVDGIGWSVKRKQIPLYFTALRKVYELSIYIDASKMPVLFIRDINTQNGKVKEYIKYNLSYDKTVSLVSKKGIVPTISRITSLMDEQTHEYMSLAKECIRCSRVVYNSLQTGTEFNKAFLECV